MFVAPSRQPADMAFSLIDQEQRSTAQSTSPARLRRERRANRKRPVPLATEGAPSLVKGLVGKESAVLAPVPGLIGRSAYKATAAQRGQGTTDRVAVSAKTRGN